MSLKEGIRAHASVKMREQEIAGLDIVTDGDCRFGKLRLDSSERRAVNQTSSLRLRDRETSL
jgi:hypothetical protein